MRLEFLIFLVISFYLLIKYKNRIGLHLVINLIMYGFYVFLWWMMYQPFSSPQHGDKGLGFAFMTIGTIPFYLSINIFNAIKNRKKLDINQKNVFYIHIIGLILGVSHLSVFLYLVL